MSKDLIVPFNRDRNKTILAQRGADLRWFTPLGFKNIPAERSLDAKGKATMIPNGGWVQVDPSKFTQAPDPLKPAEVTATEAAKDVDPKAPAAPTGAAANVEKKKEDAKDVNPK